MSNIYNLEPQAFGHITLKTSFGDIDVELFTKQCPKATKNFVQLCLDRYYEDTVFERVEKDFIAIGGAQVSDSAEEEHTFNDEFHPRLRFSRRGLLATANTEKNANGSKFFFTLGAAPELQNKHTIFGRVKGNSVYTLVNLNECTVDDNLRPIGEKKIERVDVLENPFPDLVPREQPKIRLKESNVDLNDDYDPLSKPKPDSRQAKKLSFYDEDDDDEEVDEDIVSAKKNEKNEQTTHIAKVKMNNFNEKRVSSPKEDEVDDQSSSKEAAKSDSDEERNNGSVEPCRDKAQEKERKLREIRAQIEAIKKQIENESEKSESSTSERRKRGEDLSSSANTTASSEPQNESGTKGASKKNLRVREQETIMMVERFKKRLRQSADSSSGARLSDETNGRGISIEGHEDIAKELALADSDDWLNHRFEADDENEEETRLAKDANMKTANWYTIDDPRSSLSKPPTEARSTYSHRDHHHHRHRRDHYHDDEKSRVDQKNRQSHNKR